MKNTHLLFFLLFAFLLPFQGFSHGETKSDFHFTENKGQLDQKVQFHTKLHLGDIYFEKTAFTFDLYCAEDLDEAHEIRHGGRGKKQERDTPLKVRKGVYKMQFVGANATPHLFPEEQKEGLKNYFKGKDQSKWASGVRSYKVLNYGNLYPSINAKIYTQHDHLKYDFIIEPGGDPAKIIINYKGAESLQLMDGNLEIKLPGIVVKEMRPVAYQSINGRKTEIPCEFSLHGTEVSFLLPNGYDGSKELIIDPTWVFSTLTGSTADNWGFTATYDLGGNFYGGGIADGTGLYPTTIGAYDVTYGGWWDAVITKFNPTGTTLVYSTYLGGSEADIPHSIVTDAAGNLIVFGVTSSTDFPTLPGAYDENWNDGDYWYEQFGYGIEYYNGTDLFIAKLDANGENLLGSTYLGGTKNDGLSLNTNLRFNYGDHARGEVVLDDNNNIYITSCTRSTNFPTSSGSHQPGWVSGYEGIVSSLSSDLSTLLWSTYVGGGGADAGYSIRVNETNNMVAVCGGTRSDDIGATLGTINYTRPGGTDGFVATFNKSTGALNAMTYIGTSSYDQAYILEIDNDNNIYVTGQTKGNYPVTPGVYSNTNANQFIHKLNSSLTTTDFSTVFGSGSSNNQVDISISAFLVDTCDNIYVAGWGGTTNNEGSTNNMPLTPSTAIQTSTDGSDFYFIVLARDADSLLYGTYFGSPSAAEHVDGGTSRFDKQGTIYQGVCAGCGGNSFPISSPGVYSPNNGSSNCNYGAIKIHFDFQGITASAINPGDITLCSTPYTVNFSAGPNPPPNAFWNFGDSNSSTAINPTHTYADTGTYQIMYVAIDSSSCNIADTAYFNITITAAEQFSAQFNIPPPDPCADTMFMDLEFTGTGADSIVWDMGDGNIIINDTLFNYYYTTPGTYTITMTAYDFDCNNTGSVSQVINFNPSITYAQATAPPNVVACNAPYDVDFTTTGSPPPPNVFWDFGDGNSSTDLNPTHTYSDTGTYQVMYVAIDSSTCNIADTAYFTVTLNVAEQFSAQINIPPPNPCEDTMFVYLEFTGTGADSIVWDMGDGNVIINDTLFNYYYTVPGTYVITMTAFDSICNHTGSVAQILEFNPTFSLAQATAPPNVFSCEPPFEVDFTTTGNPPPPNVFWDFGDGTGTSTLPNITYTYADTGTYQVMYVAIDSSTCNIADTVYFTVQFEQGEQFDATFEIPVLPPCRTSDSLWVQLDFTGSGADSIVWDMGDGSIFINDTVVNYLYLEPGNYLISMTAYDFICNHNGTFSEWVDFAGTYDDVFVPNAFTPNGDGNNDSLYVRGNGIDELHFALYNRWGELVFETKNQSLGWGGQYKEREADPGVFVYYLNLRYCDGEKYFEKGNVTLIR